MTMMDDLLVEGALRVDFQPIVRVGSDGVELYALEALTRGPRGSTMERPDVLFEYARRKGEEIRIDLVCIVEALAAAATLPAAPHLSINVHASTLANTDYFTEMLIGAASAHGIEPQRLMLEIVEHRAPCPKRPLQTTLADLREAGVRIALDDLGVGASNYHMFIDGRPDHIKIDRYIVAGCSSDPYRLAVIRSLVALGQECGATPIAEGVEENADLAAVREAGIDLVQGWIYSRSLPAAELAVSHFLQPPVIN